jgi:hypothetical protein
MAECKKEDHHLRTGIGEKYVRSLLDVNEAGKSISEGSKRVGSKLSQMCKVLYIRHELLYMYQMRLNKAISRDS